MFPGMFCDVEHEKFYSDMLSRFHRQDAYHRALFYTLGLTRETRTHVQDLFDFSNDSIRPKGLKASWQTGTSLRASRLAFNLWNGWAEEQQERDSTPHELFDCRYAPYFFEAIRLRYPEYCRSHDRVPQRMNGPTR